MKFIKLILSIFLKNKSNLNHTNIDYINFNILDDSFTRKFIIPLDPKSKEDQKSISDLMKIYGSDRSDFIYNGTPIEGYVTHTEKQNRLRTEYLEKIERDKKINPQ